MSLQKAVDLIASARGKELSPSDRQTQAITLASHLLKEASKEQTFKERLLQGQLARMMSDPKGKAFTTCMTDECFRSKRPSRAANQMVHLLEKFGIPRYLGPLKRLQLQAFRCFGKLFSYLFVPLAIFMLRKETSSVILPGETEALSKHMLKRRKEGVRLNLNHLGEAILGEKEAKTRLHVYLEDLTKHDIEYVSVKISTIYSQINLLAWDKTLDVLAVRLRELYRVAMAHPFVRPDGSQIQKFVNLDMEEYRDLRLTKELFKKVLNEPEFHRFSAGIVLQAYLPDSFPIQQELTLWAMERVKAGGAPIKIRIVKGANLAMEQFEASVRDWHQAPYTSKVDVDANYKRMVTYACIPAHAKAVHIGVASHNLFDISYALLLRAENRIEKEISFEMLEGMADHMRRVVQKLAHEILLYCPVAKREDFQSAVAYLIRRLDENTAPDNFLRHAFGLKPNTPQWEEQASLFLQAAANMKTASTRARRTQNRLELPKGLPIEAPFENEADTDFSLPQNQEWVEQIRKKWHRKKHESIPLVIGGRTIHQPKAEGEGADPSFPNEVMYTYSLATWEQVDEALNIAKAYEKTWGTTSVKYRCHLLAVSAQKMRERRNDLIGVMMADGGKTPFEGDPEVSEAIDFADYYLRSMHKMNACKDIEWSPKGTILVTPPWNFPVSIPAGGILAALVSGNCVIFKPAPEAVLTGWVLVNLLWEAGIPKEALQFVNCADDPVGSKLIADSRVSTVILTGATATARLFKKLKPDLDLSAETGGKNAMIITDLSDRDLAIKDLIHSAFSHSGQKCSAASLAILESSVYDDPHFLDQLRDAVESLTVGSQWDPASKVIPLIREPHSALLKGLTELEPGETWLVEPRQDPQNPYLWSPGVKLGVIEGSFMHQTELFGPVLGVMRAKNLSHALKLANGTAYGLTAGIHSLDDREQKQWMQEIEAGNCYVNRTTTGAIVRRQPFGGHKASGYGHGAKAGGPNYVAQFMIPKEVALPQEKLPVKEPVNQLTRLISKLSLSQEELGKWSAAIGSYAYFAHHFKQLSDPSKIMGQDNLFGYKLRKKMALRIQEKDNPLDILCVCAAALSLDLPLEISWTKSQKELPINDQWPHILSAFTFTKETEEKFIQRLKKGAFERVRLLTPPSQAIQLAANESLCFLAIAPALANGRFELLHYLKEVAYSIDYHRYGNLGLRETEHFKPLL